MLAWQPCKSFFQQSPQVQLRILHEFAISQEQSCYIGHRCYRITANISQVTLGKVSKKVLKHAQRFSHSSQCHDTELSEPLLRDSDFLLLEIGSGFLTLFWQQFLVISTKYL